jgi:hypothetical protein
MAKYRRYDYSQSVLIPVSLQEQLVPGTLEFAIHTGQQIPQSRREICQSGWLSTAIQKVYVR